MKVQITLIQKSFLKESENMECGDYKGTIDFLDDFNRSQKAFKEFRNIINNITEESLSKVLDGDIDAFIESNLKRGL